MLNARPFGHFNGSIAAAIIHKDNVVNYIKGISLYVFQRFLSIIGRENNGYYFVIDHFAAVLRAFHEYKSILTVQYLQLGILIQY